MLRNESLKNFIEELIQEVEKELDEANVTGNIDGYQTPHAFSGKNSSNRRKKTATQLGYTLVDNDVENIDESISEGILTEKQFKGLEGIPANTSLEKISTAQKLKIIKAPGNIIDFSVPKGVSRNFWQVIGTGKIKKNLSGEFYLEGKIINSPMFKSMDDLIDGVKWKSMEERRRFNESVNEAKELKWQDVEVGDAANVKAINKTGLIIKTYGRKFHLKFPNGSTKTYDANELNFVKNESINENRWLAIKNDESMHAHKKLAMGLKELKYQLSEVEKFFNWYNKIKNINELESSDYWKRTNNHIYKIKERIVNIARTLKEIEK